MGAFELWVRHVSWCLPSLLTPEDLANKRLCAVITHSIETVLLLQLLETLKLLYSSFNRNINQFYDLFSKVALEICCSKTQKFSSLYCPVWQQMFGYICFCEERLIQTNGKSTFLIKKCWPCWNVAGLCPSAEGYPKENYLKRDYFWKYESYGPITKVFLYCLILHYW